MDELIKADQDLLDKAKSNYKKCEDYWRNNRKIFLDDCKFIAGDQWPEEIVRAREADGRPCLTVDKSKQYIRQVVNDARQNRPSIKIQPEDDNGDIEVAEVLGDIARHISYKSNADEAYDWAIECAVKGGFGFIRVITDYASDKTFNQDIFIKRVPNALSVLVSPHQEADGADITEAFVTTDVPVDEFKEQWPDAECSNWEDERFNDDWSSENTIKVCEWFYKVKEDVLHHLLIDGTVVSDDEYQTAVAEIGIDSIPQIQESRKLPIFVVKWCRLTGAEILEKKDWPGKDIPIVPCYGNEDNLGGEVIYTGLINSAKDAMRLYNFSRSAYAERVALTPKSPYIADALAIEGHPEWEDANVRNYSVLQFNSASEDGRPLPMPQRQPAADIPAGFSQDMQLSEHDIQAAMGMYAANLGQQGNEKSGKAILARQREGDTATFHFIDNLNRAVRRVGEIVVNLIPKIYDTRRVVRLMGEDGEVDEAIVDPNQPMPKQKIGEQTIYNFGTGIYDAVISAGPSYTTRRTEQAEAMMQLIQANPSIMQIAGDLVVKSQDWPNADQLADRLKLMLPPQIREAEQKEQGASKEMMQAQQFVNQAMQQVEQAKQQVQQVGMKMQQDQQKIESDRAQLEAERAKLEAAKSELDATNKILTSRYQELSAKLELQAMKTTQVMQSPVL